MTTKLQTIQQAVAAHEAAKEAHERGEVYNLSGLPQVDKPMSLLRDVLPLLELAAKIELNDGKLPEFQWYSLIQDYDTEVTKLTKDEV